MAKESMAQLRNRVRQQVTQAHPQPETVINDTSPKLERVSNVPPQPITPAQDTRVDGDTKVHTVGTNPQKRRRSRWTNLYPDAMPFQTSVYLTEEDLVLIKSLRLRLHFAREWMVLKYALEKLDQAVEAQDTK